MPWRVNKRISALVLCGGILGVLGSPSPSFAVSRLYFSPANNLEAIDIGILSQATRSVDIAMYAFTDRPIAETLLKLARKRVVIRLYRDGTQLRDKNDVTSLLQGQPGIHIRVKPSHFWNIQHLKGYVVDGVALREGSANWSPAGLGAACFRGSCGRAQQQDNDLFVTDNPALVRVFEDNFNHIWQRADNRRP